MTEEVLGYNQRATVLEHRAGADARFNARFIDLAGYYGFVPRACQPYRARTKGKDERMVRYIKEHFFVRYRSFESWAHLNQQAEQWLQEEADGRIHGTVKEVVAERFVREAPSLHALPVVRYDTSYHDHRQVASDSYIDVRGNRYSVPSALIGQTVTVRIGLEGTLRVYADTTLVAQHTLQGAQQGWVTVSEHHRPLWQATLKVEQRSLAVYEAVL